MNIEAETIVMRLVSEFDYPQKRAEEAVQKLQRSAPVIQEAFEKWWMGDGLDEQLLVEGYTLQQLVEEYDFNPMNAFLTLDWLLREPARAREALSRGYDYFLVSPEVRAEYERHKKRGKNQ